jgi:hypothetical protein
MKPLKSSRAIAFALCAAAAIACADHPTNIGGLHGLDFVSTPDSGLLTPDTSAAPGYIHGYVYGYGGGSDSSQSAPRLVNVKVTAYVNDPSNSSGHGAEVANVVTDANGEFALPKLPFGTYLVTFEPPAPLGYRGAYVVATSDEQTGRAPWWIFLKLN